MTKKMKIKILIKNLSKEQFKAKDKISYELVKKMYLRITI